MADRSNSTVAQFEVRSDGAPIPLAMAEDLLEITVDSSVHQPDMAVLSFIDRDFHWSDASELEPGRELRIKFGYERDLEEVFVARSPPSRSPASRGADSGWSCAATTALTGCTAVARRGPSST